MDSFHSEPCFPDSAPPDVDSDADAEQLESARRIALESIEEDHRALERDAKLAYSPALLLG
ncbi:hypothetical protein LZP81_31600 [Streptomyces parvulus]|uniref:hypothetical protein n=1 Tax=Streptomyces TaxID=1883 RepID=UPI0013702922|nr:MULTISPECIES: hypothetical protein [Streptomyces]MCC9158499.1 hypothetical protein [Streptomyces parvulus]MCE7691400.1 hypothetical protein [Streptomyces parvulus]MZD56294.1 hypothetical protein [Streptomyces sp. SID5606]WML83723.1 hypothetical protein Q3101_29415 [Streptomyces sp. VNUA74]